MWTGWIGFAALGTLLAAAVARDLSERQIPNSLVLAVAGAGTAAQALLPPGAGLFDPARPGGTGLALALACAGFSLAIGFLFWRGGFLGAGDAKLLGATAIWFGPEEAAVLLLSTLAAGGLLAAAVLMMRRAGTNGESGSNIASGLGGTSSTSLRLSPGRRFPYSPAIATGALLAALAQASGWLPH
jgi:prepilin peptidase CpaA